MDRHARELTCLFTLSTLQWLPQAPGDGAGSTPRATPWRSISLSSSPDARRPTATRTGIDADPARDPRPRALEAHMTFEPRAMTIEETMPQLAGRGRPPAEEEGTTNG